jgi:hypothetical protein
MEPERLQRVLARLDALNRDDPNQEVVHGVRLPRELAYSERLTDWVLRLNPQASEALRIAARGQHVRRWTIPREEYPRTRAGYLKWRERLKAFHAELVAHAMREEGCADEDIERVRLIITKKQLGRDPDTQTIEDALCLIFLETQFADVQGKVSAEKMADIVRRTWAKMSPRAREEALRLPVSDEQRALLRRLV